MESLGIFLPAAKLSLYGRQVSCFWSSPLGGFSRMSEGEDGQNENGKSTRFASQGRKDLGLSDVNGQTPL